MSAASSTPSKKKRDARSPVPKRGQIKAQIFESLKKTVISAVSGKAGIRGDSTPAAGTPSASAYNSDANSEIA